MLFKKQNLETHVPFPLFNDVLETFKKQSKNENYIDHDFKTLLNTMIEDRKDVMEFVLPLAMDKWFELWDRRLEVLSFLSVFLSTKVIFQMCFELAHPAMTSHGRSWPVTRWSWPVMTWP